MSEEGKRSVSGLTVEKLLTMTREEIGELRNEDNNPVDVVEMLLEEIRELRKKWIERKPKIVCLCGSTKFIDLHAIIKWKLEKEGAIVLSMTLLPFNYPNVQPDHQAEFEGIKDKMDELHLRKIDLADRVFIINKDGYIGESTWKEINYATKLGKPIGYLERLTQ